MQKYALFIFLWNIMGLLRPFFSESLIFALSNKV